MDLFQISVDPKECLPSCCF